MSFMNTQFLLTVLFILLGTGLFLRMVAKEKHRREKYLELRQYEKERAEAERQKNATGQAASGTVPVAPLAQLRSSKTENG